MNDSTLPYAIHTCKHKHLNAHMNHAKKKQFPFPEAKRESGVVRVRCEEAQTVLSSAGKHWKTWLQRDRGLSAERFSPAETNQEKTNPLEIETLCGRFIFTK